MSRPAIRRRVRATFLDHLLPRACVACGRAVLPAAPPACALCLARLPRVPAPRCPRCAAPRTGRFPEGGCSECEGWPAELSRAAAPFRMDGPAARLVHALKYDGWTALAGPMGRAMAPSARALLDAAGAASARPLLVPVPLSRSRLRERGFNQAALLARELARATGWSSAETLARTSTGRRQAGSGRHDRAGNVRSAFLPVPEAEGRMRGRTPILVDDVLTTGATAAACARAFEQAGSTCAGVVTFARALRPLAGD